MGDLNLFSSSGNCVKCDPGSFINNNKACQKCPRSRFFLFVHEKLLLRLFKVGRISCLWKKVSSTERGIRYHIFLFVIVEVECCEWAVWNTRIYC